MLLSIECPSDFDFVQCVTAHGWRQLAPFSWDDQQCILSRLESFAGCAPVLLRIQARGAEIEVELPDTLDPSAVIERVRKMLQLDLDLAAFYHYCRGQNKLTHIPDAQRGRLLRSPTLFEDILKVIATTNTTWVQTKLMTARLVAGFGAVMQDGTGNSFPTPDSIASVSLEEFSSIAKMGYRNASVHKIATDIVSGRLDIDALEDRNIPSPELYKRLLELPGVGPYAASSLMLYLGRYDRVNVDSWARTLVGRELNIKATDKDVHAFFEPYGEWRALVYHFYPWREEPLSY